MKTTALARGSWRLFQPKTMVSFLSLVVAGFNSSAQNADYIYTNNSGTITITKYIGSGGAVTIPSNIDGLPVTSIGFMAFMSSKVTTSVTIPDSVTSIEAGAFRACALSTVAIPSSVTNLGTTVFLTCDKLTAITVDALKPSYSSEEGVLFNKGQTTILQYPGGKTGSYQVPETVSLIGEGAFLFCSRLTSVAIPNTVNQIGRSAFGSTSLTSVIIPNSVTNIGHMAFSGCTKLTGVTIPNGIATIENYAFSHCTSLTNVIIPISVTRIGDWVFSGCTGLTAVYFQGNAPRSGSVFGGNNNMTVYYLPGTTGWGTTFGDCPTALWLLPHPVILTTAPGFGMQANQFGFIISWATNASVVVEANPSIYNHNWSPIATNTLIDGSSYFSDPQWTNFSSRFYRVRSP